MAGTRSSHMPMETAWTRLPWDAVAVMIDSSDPRSPCT